MKKLDVADYSVVGLEDKIAIEKKSLSDLCACVGRERDRFERMLQKLNTYEHYALVVTADWSHIDNKMYRGQLTPTQIYAALMSWWRDYKMMPLFAGDHIRAGKLVARLLWVAAKSEL